jgi:hypothetical protein
MTREQAARLGVGYERIRENRIAANSIKRVGEPEDIPNVCLVPGLGGVEAPDRADDHRVRQTNCQLMRPWARQNDRT